jgi:hypothetical protein
LLFGIHWICKQSVGFVSGQLEDAQKFNLICRLLLAINQVHHNYRGAHLKELVIEAIAGDMCQVVGGKFKLVNVHLKKLIHAVEEENEVGCIVLAVVDIWPCLHLKT